ncbi:MAG: hypothetical protein KF862_18130 [Chitinophagaceae bacterium]|nr:hypothetical protein [Chitinophagaceae bacterium]
MPLFDFHVHPTLKCMFSETETKSSPWTDIDVKQIPWILRWCSDFEYILGSQANLRQLNTDGPDIICVAIFVPERGMTNNKLILKQAQGTLQKYLNPERLKKMNDETLKPYPDLVTEDLEVLLNAGSFGITDKKVKILLRDTVYDENDTSSMYVIFSVEGCHSLSSTLDKTRVSKNEILENLDEIAGKYPLVSVNITHLEQYPFCNHAYGIQFIANEDFRPTGNRISADGLDMIRHCYKRKIMVDVKHLSLASRRMLTEDIRHRLEFIPINQPLICTHAGFTGLSYKDIPDYMDYKAERKKNYSYILWGKPKKYGMLDFMTAFNPSSINLYDEDIMAILKSGGMIGLNLDKRILGYSEADGRPAAMNELAFEEEYISNAERDVYLTRRTIGKKLDDFHCITMQEVLQGGVVNPAVSFYHLCHFMSHILHFIKVVQEHSDYDIQKALTQICIGSDFDGLINPVWCCSTVLDIPSFKKAFTDTFMRYAHANRNIVALPAGFDVQQFARQLFFENGKNFILERLRIMYA